MWQDEIVWRSETATDGRELVTFGTPEFPVEMWGPWNGSSEHEKAIPWHWHEELELTVSIRGEERMMADGKVFHTKPGHGLFVNAGVLHRSEGFPQADQYLHYALVFHPWLVGGAPGSVFWQKYLAPVLNAPECRCVPLRGETVWEKQILAQVERVGALWPEKRPGYEFEVRDALSQIIFLLAENCLQHAPAPTPKELRDAARIKQMVTFIQNHTAEPLTTAQIAASAAVSVSECLRCFRQMLDLTPKEYLKQHRIRHAARLLEQTDRSITQIGVECGFEDMSYFARVFRAEKGCTPSAYRKKLAKSGR